MRERVDQGVQAEQQRQGECADAGPGRANSSTPNATDTSPDGGLTLTALT